MFFWCSFFMLSVNSTTSFLLSPLFALLCCGHWSLPLKKGMNSLPRGVNPDLPKNELIRKFVPLLTSVLIHHRLALFCEACNQSLMLPDYVNLPLVGWKNTAIKPASHKLSEDIWTIISCIQNKKKHSLNHVQQQKT